MTLYDELPALDSRKAAFFHTSPLLTPIHIYLKKPHTVKREVGVSNWILSQPQCASIIEVGTLRKTGLEISHEKCLKLESSLSLTQLKKNAKVIDLVRDQSANQLLKTNWTQTCIEWIGETAAICRR